MVNLITKMLGTPLVRSDDLPCVRIQQKLVRVEPMSGVRLVRTTGAQSVYQTGASPRQKSVENAILRSYQTQPRLFHSTTGIEHAQVYRISVFGKHRKVDTPITHHRPQRRGTPLQQRSQVHAGTRNNVASGGRRSDNTRSRPCSRPV